MKKPLNQLSIKDVFEIDNPLIVHLNIQAEYNNDTHEFYIIVENTKEVGTIEYMSMKELENIKVNNKMSICILNSCYSD